MEPQNNRISKPLYITLITYLLITIFQSASLEVCILSALTVVITQLILFPVLPLIAARISKRFLPFVAALLASVIGTALSFLLNTGFGFVFTSGSVFFPNPSFILIAVPLFVSQAENRSDYSFPFVMKGILGFSFFLLVTSALRGVLGFGTLLGVSFFSGETGPLPILTHISGSTFLVVSLLLICLILYRMVAKRHVVLDMNLPFYQHQPVFDMSSLSRELRLFFALFLVTFLTAVPLYAFSFFVFLPEYAYFLSVTILVLGIVQAVFYLLFSKNQDFCSSYFDKKYLFPVQAGIVAFPAGIFFPLASGKEHGILLFLMISFFILFACCVEAAVLLFIRSLRRKALFGKRPEILQGVPYIFLIFSLCFMVLSGFGDVPGGILSKIPF